MKGRNPLAASSVFQLGVTNADDKKYLVVGVLPRNPVMNCCSELQSTFVIIPDLRGRN